jgi:hypothetical protein
VLESVSAFLIAIGINPTHLAAGLAGSVVRAMLTKARSKWEMFSVSIVGMFCATYLTPIIVKWIALDADTTNGVAFGIGLIGMSLAEGFVRMAQNWSVNPRLPGEASLKGLAEAVNPPAPPAPSEIDITEVEKPDPVIPVRRKRRL